MEEMDEIFRKAMPAGVPSYRHIDLSVSVNILLLFSFIAHQPATIPQNGPPDTHLSVEMPCTQSASIRITPIEGFEGLSHYLDFIHPGTKMPLAGHSGLELYSREVDDEKSLYDPAAPDIYRITPYHRYEVWSKGSDGPVAKFHAKAAYTYLMG
jgi:hypothetical protein